MNLKPVRNIALVLDGPDAAACRHAMTTATSGIDLFELRVDLLPEAERTPAVVRDLVTASARPVVVTCRSAEEGGAATIADADRELLLRAALDAGARLIDCEWRWVERDRTLLDRFPADRLMVSHHEWDDMPRDPARLLAGLMAAPARAVKLVARAASFEDLVWLDNATEQIQRNGRLAACFAVGPYARTSRILSALAGAHLIYVCSGEASPASPDLLSVEDAIGLYRLGDLSDSVKLLGVLGHPVRRSLSPRMHNGVIRTLGERYIYVPFDSPTPGPVIEYARTHDVRGLSVTIPHKETVMPLLDGLDPTARDAGAVNTIVHTAHGLIGHNTDLIACRAIFKEWAASTADTALLIGAGGAARSAARALGECGVPLTVLNRDPARGKRFAAEFGGSYGGAPEKAAKIDASIVVNATPAGAVDDLPSWPARVSEETSVLDLAYRPEGTALVRKAEDAGARTVSGLDFLARQGACQFALWTRRIVNVDLFRDALAARPEPRA